MKQRTINGKLALAGLMGLAAYELILLFGAFSGIYFSGIYYLDSNAATSYAACTTLPQLFTVLLAVFTSLAAIKPLKAWTWVAAGLEFTLALFCLVLGPAWMRLLGCPAEAYSYGVSYLRTGGLFMLIGCLLAAPCLFLRLIRKDMSLLIMVIAAGAAVLLSLLWVFLGTGVMYLGIAGMAMSNLFHPMLMLLPILLYHASPFPQRNKA